MRERACGEARAGPARPAVPPAAAASDHLGVLRRRKSLLQNVRLWEALIFSPDNLLPENSLETVSQCWSSESVRVKCVGRMMPTAERVGGPPTRPARGVRPARPPPPAAHLYRPPPVDRPRQHQHPPPPPRASCPPRPLHVGASNGRHAPRPCGHAGGLGGGRRAKWCGKAASWAWLPLNAAARVESALNTCWPTPSLHVLLACLPCLAPSAAR